MTSGGLSANDWAVVKDYIADLSIIKLQVNQVKPPPGNFAINQAFASKA